VLLDRGGDGRLRPDDLRGGPRLEAAGRESDEREKDERAREGHGKWR